VTDVGEIRNGALPLDAARDLDPLLERIGDARYVLIGEASHGTHEFYAWRSALTQRLIAELGFGLVGVEGDWPACWRVHRGVTLAETADPYSVLDGLRAWPSWLWSNDETADFCRWLREHNADLPDQRRVGWYGLEGYPLWASTREVVGVLDKRMPGRVAEVLDDFQQGGRLAPPDLTDEVVDALLRMHDSWRPARLVDRWETFNDVLNIALRPGAETFFRSMLTGGPAAWNDRDEHMLVMLERLRAFHGAGTRAVVWAHNTHIGDARATTMGSDGLLNIGQLIREKHGQDQVVAVGFAGGAGEVLAAPRRGASMAVLPVPAAREDSVEALLAGTGLERALFVFPRADEVDAWPAWLRAELPHRAIGVVYDPEDSAYVPTRMGERYDALLWIGHTSALHALHLAAARRGELEALVE
jgi:erythromycin esterase-like protein